jgi:hypothetical protein
MTVATESLFTSPASPAPGAGISLRETDTILDVVRANGPKNVDIRDMVVDIQIERTISGASTIEFTIHDPERHLLRSPALAVALEITFDGYGYRLFSKKKSGPTITLTFEDKIINVLRHKKELVRASRAEVTRMQFCIRLCRRVKLMHIPVFAPESAKKFGTEDFSRDDNAKLANRDSGFNNKDRLPDRRRR